MGGVSVVRRTQTGDLSGLLQDEIDRQVAARTSELQVTIQHLRRELQQRDQAEAALRFLAEVNRMVAPALNSTSILHAVVHSVVPFLGDYCMIELLGANEGPRRVDVAHRDEAKEGALLEEWCRWHPALDGPSPFATVLRTRRSLVIPYFTEPSPCRTLLDEEFLQIIKSAGVPGSWMTVPLLAGSRLLGTLSLVRTQLTSCYGPLDQVLAEEVASRAMVAIEHARLYEQAQEVAVLQERQRLAHELHDAVTQMLFSASLIAQVLPQMWEHDQSRGRQSLEDLRLLTRGALAEMRGLLLELRPTALTTSSLGDLLQHLTEALTGRTRIPVDLTVKDGRDEPHSPLPPEIQITFYRIAQEALSNIAKHARASEVSLHLRIQSTGVELRIHDDGRGFDPNQIVGDHFGLDIMGERAAAIGGSLSIGSQPGSGTEILLCWRR